MEETGSSESADIIKYWNSLKNYPGYFGEYTYTETNHNGYRRAMSSCPTPARRETGPSSSRPAIRADANRIGISMLASIIASGLAVGAIYALIGVTYNTMFMTSRVMSFTAGQLGMVGGVFGSLFALRLGLPGPRLLLARSPARR